MIGFLQMVGVDGSMDYLRALVWCFQLVADHSSGPRLSLPSAILSLPEFGCPRVEGLFEIYHELVVLHVRLTGCGMEVIYGFQKLCVDSKKGVIRPSRMLGLKYSSFST